MKKGVVSIITIVLIILLVIVMMVVLWNVYFYLIRGKLADVSADSFLVDGEIEYYLPDQFAIVKVKRKPGITNITGLSIFFNEKNTGLIYIYNTSDVPKELETKKYVIYKNDLNPLPSPTWNFGFVASIALRFLFPDKKFSREIDKKAISLIKISEGFNEKCWYNDSDNDGYGNKLSICNMSSVPIKNMTPENTDCNDTNESIHPGALEKCNHVDDNCDGKVDEGTGPNCLRNYSVTTLDMHSLWKEDCPSSWIPVATFPKDISLLFNFNFYTENINNVWLCKQGHLSIGGSADCYSYIGVNNPSLSTLTSRKTIAPYIVKKETFISSVEYCKGDPFIIRWTNAGGGQSESIIYSDGKIEYSYYNNPIEAEIGIARDNNYYNEALAYAVTNKDYIFYLP